MWLPVAEYLHGAVGSHLHVGRLEIAMDDAGFVRRFECVGDLPRNWRRVAHGYRATIDDRVTARAWFRAQGSLRVHDIRFCEIVTLEQERLAGCHRQGIREAVAVIQVGWMVALAVSPEGKTAGFGLLCIKGDDGDTEFPQKPIELDRSRLAMPRFDDDACFEKCTS